MAAQRIRLRDLRLGLRFAARVHGLVQQRITLEAARATVTADLAARETYFLEHLRRIFQQASHPYLELFQNAGCELADIERLVQREGLEGALFELFRSGVYLTVDELKGRQPVRRGSRTFE